MLQRTSAPTPGSILPTSQTASAGMEPYLEGKTVTISLQSLVIEGRCSLLCGLACKKNHACTWCRFMETCMCMFKCSHRTLLARNHLKTSDSLYEIMRSWQWQIAKYNTKISHGSVLVKWWLANSCKVLTTSTSSICGNKSGCLVHHTCTQVLYGGCPGDVTQVWWYLSRL